METDKFYATTVRDLIFSEYSAAAAVLASKAQSLGMQIRDKDIDFLRREMHQRAFNHGNCLDRAVLAQAESGATIETKKYVAFCVRASLFIAEKIGRGAFKELLTERELKKASSWAIDYATKYRLKNDSELCVMKAQRFDVPIFDFLREENKLSVYPAIDYLSARDCIVKVMVD
jgi:hypothetical protein